MSNSSSTTKKAGKVTFAQTKLTWHIDKISEYCKVSKIQSPVFITKVNTLETKWSLALISDKKCNQDSPCDRKYFGIYLKSLNDESLRATVYFSLLNVSNTEVDCLKFDQEFKPQNDWGFSTFVKQEYLFDEIQRQRRYSLDDSCTIVCTITVNEFIKVETKKNQIELERLKRLKEFDQFWTHYNDKSFSDIVIFVENKEIHAHKVFLATKSPVFKAMFTHNMSESNSNRVEISDLSYNSVRGMLKYIYTGIVADYGSTQKSYKDLLVAAEKYGIENLKLECEKKLSVLLSIDNIFEYLKFSDMNNAPHLKEKVIEYIVNHGEDIAALPSFKKHCSELDADIVSEVFRAFAVKKRKVE